MNGKKVSVIVLTYNGKDMTVRLLESLAKTNFTDYETVLVDNASTDGCEEYVREHFPYVRIIRNDKNLGYAGGMNVGIKTVSGKYVVLLNNDMLVDPNWLDELVKVAESDEKIGIVGGSLTSEEIDFERLGYLESNGVLLKLKPLDIPKNKLDANFPDMVQVDNTVGLIKKVVLDDIGMFDEKYFFYWEEVDLCYRAKMAGYKIVAASKSKIWHGGGMTIKKMPYMKTFHYNKNKIRFILKNLNLPRKFINVPVTISQQLLKGMEYMLRGDTKNCFAIIKGIFWNIRNFGDYV